MVYQSTEEELDILKERAKYYGLTKEKAKSFKEFRETYIDALKKAEKDSVLSSVQKNDEDTSQEKALENIGKSSIMELNLQFFAFDPKDYPTINLPKEEYAHVMSELNTHLSDEQREQKVVTKAIGNYNYTIENNGFNDYRIIGKEAIDEDAMDWWDE